MKTPALLSALAVLSTCIAAAPATAEPTLVVSPQPLPVSYTHLTLPTIYSV